MYEHEGCWNHSMRRLPFQKIFYVCEGRDRDRESDRGLSQLLFHSPKCPKRLGLGLGRSLLELKPCLPHGGKETTTRISRLPPRNCMARAGARSWGQVAALLNAYSKNTFFFFSFPFCINAVEKMSYPFVKERIWNITFHHIQKQINNLHVKLFQSFTILDLVLISWLWHTNHRKQRKKIVTFTDHIGQNHH